MYIQIETFMYAIMSQKKQSAKHQTVMLLRIRENSNSSQEVKLQVKFQVKKTPPWLETPIPRHSTGIMLIDIHKQAIEKYQQVKFKRQAEEQKQREAPWDFVYTLLHI